MKRWQVQRGEALHLLQQLPDDHVAAVVTDPPYSSGGFTRGDRVGADTTAKYVSSSTARELADFAGDNRDQRGYLAWCALWMAEALRVTRPGGSLLVFTDWRQLPVTTDAVQAGGWVWRGLVPWCKPNARPQVGRRFRADCEFVVRGTRGPLGSGVDDMAVLPGWYLHPPPRDREHITQKPVELLRELVAIAPEGGLVLDPFTGSGTTGVAALLTGRPFLGFELTHHYAAVAAERCAAVADGFHRQQPAQGVLL